MDAIEIVMQYISTKLQVPQIEWGRNEFDQRIYERWAAEEILQRLLLQCSADPVEVVEGFLLYLVSSTATCVDNKKMIFSAAIHTAEDILNLLSKEYTV